MKRIGTSFIAGTLCCLALQSSAQEGAIKPPDKPVVVKQSLEIAESREVATHPNAVLSTFVDDSFVSDSRKDYQIKGDVQWSPGKLTLQPKASISRSLRCGPRVKMHLKLHPPVGPRADETQEIKVVFTPASVASFGWDNIAAGVPATVTIRQKMLENKQIEVCVTAKAADSGQPNWEIWDQPWNLFRELIVERPSYVTELDIEYRFGVLTVFFAGKPVLYGQTRNQCACLQTIIVEPSLGQVEINQLGLSVSPEPKLPPFAQRLRLLEAAAADIGGMRKTNAGQDEEGEKQLRKGYELCKEILDEEHEYTRTALSHLAFNLMEQGKHGQAETLQCAALELSLGLLGEMNIGTLEVYNSLAVNLHRQAKHAQAQPLFQKSLDLCRELCGERHGTTAQMYSGLASSLFAQGRYAEARPLAQKSLELSRELHGERHPFTAKCYHNLALISHGQGRYAEGLPLIKRSFDLSRNLLGEQHLGLADEYINLASTLVKQGKYTEAQPLYQKGLDLLGEEHPFRVHGLAGLAGMMERQKQFSDAQGLYQQALDLSRKLHGEKHPDTANIYHSLALSMLSKGKPADAQPLFQKALDINREVLGEQHPSVTMNYVNIAFNLTMQGKSAEAQEILERGINSYETSRLIGATGLDRAALNISNPRLLLASLRAKTEPKEAWLTTEMTLARGLLDQQATQKSHLLPPMEFADQEKWQSELASLQAQIHYVITKSNRSDSEIMRLNALTDQRRQVEKNLAALAVQVSQRGVALPQAIQAALPNDAALLFWVDITSIAGRFQEHWGCIVRATGDPKWEQLPGTGTEDQWIQADTELPAKLRETLAGNTTVSEIAALAHQLRAQRLAPLEKHLAGVKTLYVVPVNEMAGIPVEALTSDYTVSYIPSGTFLTRLKDLPKLTGEALFALADPIFTDPAEKPKEPASLPPGGLLVSFVAPGGFAEQAGLKAGDVLLKYGDTDLADINKLNAAMAKSATAKTIPVTI